MSTTTRRATIEPEERDLAAIRRLARKVEAEGIGDRIEPNFASALSDERLIEFRAEAERRAADAVIAIAQYNVILGRRGTSTHSENEPTAIREERDRDDDQSARDLLAEDPDAWRATGWIADVLGWANPGPMGDDGRARALRALRRLEAQGEVEMQDRGETNYYWRAVAEFIERDRG